VCEIEGKIWLKTYNHFYEIQQRYIHKQLKILISVTDFKAKKKNSSLDLGHPLNIKAGAWKGKPDEFALPRPATKKKRPQ